jgi:predicted enzyme related to lactoylglutathione lyase
MDLTSKSVGVLACLLLASASLPAFAQSAPAAPAKPASTHNIGAAKLIVSDLPATQKFYEQMFGMKQTRFYSAPDVYDEPIMRFGGSETGGASIALFNPHQKAEAPLKKSMYPVVLVYTPDFDAVVQRIEAAKHPVRRLSPQESGTFKIAIARDPSGNAVEILSRPNQPVTVGGAKLIVDSRQKAEDFYAKVFGAKPGQRYTTAAYDEVIMNVGDGPWLALFQPKSEAPLTKSRFAVVAIYTADFDGVLKRITDEGLGYREVKTTTPGRRIIIAKDPAGNAVEIISR